MKYTSKEKCQRRNSWYNCLDIPRSRVQIPLLWDILSKAFLFILLKTAILPLGVMSSRVKSWANSSALIFENWIRGSKCWRIFFSISFIIIIPQLRWNQKKGEENVAEKQFTDTEIKFCFSFRDQKLAEIFFPRKFVKFENDPLISFIMNARDFLHFMIFWK